LQITLDKEKIGCIFEYANGESRKNPIKKLAK
jgi:hypothetical protein